MLVLTATLMAGGSVAAMLGYEQEVIESRLGPEWRCVKNAFFVTTCTHSDDWPSRSVASFGKDPRETKDDACETVDREVISIAPSR